MPAKTVTVLTGIANILQIFYCNKLQLLIENSKIFLTLNTLSIVSIKYNNIQISDQNLEL